MRRTILLFLILVASLNLIQAQEVIEVKPLFEYPVAPEEMESIQDRCDYLVKNFWNNFNFKATQPLDQYALNEAFDVYVTSFRFASSKEVDSSIDKLIKNLSGNPGLLLQFTKAAEEKLYGPRADFWIDEIYLKFLDAVIKNKKIKPNRKTKYEEQAQILRTSAIGQPAPSFWFQDQERASKQYFPMSTPSILIFGNPEDTDWRLTRLRMDSNFQLADALEKGKVNILFIIPGDLERWQESVSNYNKHWTIGQSDDVKKIYDLRLIPSVYVVGSDGKILLKNVSINDAVQAVL